MTTLAEQHDAILKTLRDGLPQLATVEAYSPGDAIDTPAALLELEVIEEDPGENDGSDRVPLRCTWTVHCVLSTRTPNVQREIRAMAAQILGMIRRQRWGGLPVRPPEQIQGGPGEISQGPHGYESWYLTWEQVLYLGDDVWLGDPPEIDTVYISAQGDEYEENDV
ncbi:hypothetical protein SAMN05660831_02093 [Thiohalospira halophila DSM 15071]|uniref:Gp37 protein n=1 Tax=Thiohalospira halophila DSM 15071 TaxID=1123397 RepID=A0A1I1UB35_9GAMM|nr:hypothetical protein [Thiohalospira halophila]SFD67979.1 hypothetical protein SAMN05660831_02093 [Thiohalospira halophila DSM 15071]